MNVREILEIFSAETGCTCPAWVILEDGRNAILKYPQNPQGIIVLFNEYFSSRIAQAINLTIPEFGIANVDQNVSIENCRCECPDVGSLSGIGFFSIRLPSTVRVSERIARRLSNLNETCKLILLDLIIKNGDRHASNVICDIKQDAGKMYAIDHSHALGDPEWDKSSLRIGDWNSPCIWRENYGFYSMLIRAGGDVGAERLSEESIFIKAIINGSLLDSIINDIPEVWVHAIGHDRIQHAKDYVLSKIQHLDEMCKMIMEESEGLQI